MTLMNKDSLEMTDADRVLITATVCGVLKENAPIVITHGTDTVVKTGLYLQRALPGLTVPIILTGAMTPLGFEESDGLQNLAESLLPVQLIRAGVYVVMHNRVYPVDRVQARTICVGGRDRLVGLSVCDRGVRAIPSQPPQGVGKKKRERGIAPNACTYWFAHMATDQRTRT
jgi:Asparaginase, N-terminal